MKSNRQIFAEKEDEQVLSDTDSQFKSKHGLVQEKLEFDEEFKEEKCNEEVYNKELDEIEVQSSKNDSTNSENEKLKYKNREEPTLSGFIFRFAEDKKQGSWENHSKTHCIFDYRIYLGSLCKKSKAEIKKYFQNKPEKLKIEERNNIRVLIIVGSEIKLNSKEFNSNQEFFLSAFLLRHIFQYVYQIPKENILVTTTNLNNFDYKYKVSRLRDTTEEDKRSMKKSKLNQKEFERLYSSCKYNIWRGFTFDDILFAQSENTEFRFATDQYVDYIIKPFNREFLQLLNTDENSHLLIFFLGHDEVGTNADFNYQIFI